MGTVAKFQGALFVVNSQEQVPDALAALENDLKSVGGGLGIDFEWKPQFEPGERNPIATVQLATGTLPCRLAPNL